MSCLYDVRKDANVSGAFGPTGSPGFARGGAVVTRPPIDDAEFCLTHGCSKVERDRAAGLRVYDDWEANSL